MKKQPTADQKAIRRFERWLRKPEAVKDLQESYNRAEKTCEELRKARKVDPRMLNIPMDI